MPLLYTGFKVTANGERYGLTHITDGPMSGSAKPDLLCGTDAGNLNWTGYPLTNNPPTPIACVRCQKGMEKLCKEGKY